MVMLLLPLISFSQTDYYYYKGEKIYLTKNYQFVNIVTSNAFDESQLTNSEIQPYTMRSEAEMRDNEYKKTAKIEFSNTTLSTEQYNEEIALFNTYAQLEGVYPFFNINGEIVGTNNYFLVKIKIGNDINLLENFAAQNNSTIIKQIPYMPFWYLLSTNSVNTRNTVKLSAVFYETTFFDAVEPIFEYNYITDPIIESNVAISNTLETCYEEGFFYAVQWNLFNNPEYPLADINVCGVWNMGYFGQGVKVAVIDTGIIEGISDLPITESVIDTSPQVPFTNNFYYDPEGPADGSHGTRSASIIGAKHDNSGMGGIAPDAIMLYIANHFTSTFNQDEIAFGINEAIWGRQSAIINMSFGSYIAAPSQELEEAIDNAVDNGRYGKGAVLIASAGNEGTPTLLYPASNSKVLSVGGSSISGKYNLLNTSPYLDVVAPSTQIITNGFNGVDDVYGWSSASAPHVSGVAALMMSSNIDISGEGVRNIIRRTTQKNSDPAHSNDTNGWYNLNKTGSRNNYMGHGIVDATECVLNAEAFDTEDLDLYIRNSKNDYGIEPDNVTRTANYVLWNSPDIWVRNELEYNFNNENPIYENSNSKAYVYVRVINKSNTNYQTGDATLKLYWSKLHNSSSWPSIWDGSTVINGVLIGGLVPSIYGNTNGIPIPAMKAGEEQILIFEWDVPNPDDFNGIFPYNDSSDFSFLARIESNNDPIDDLTNQNEVLEGTNVWINAKNNNNIAWKNVTIIETKPIGSIANGVNISNLSNETKNYSLEFVKEDNSIGKAIYEEAEVTIQLDSDLYQNWEANGSAVNNATIKSQQFKVTGNHVVFDNITLSSNEIQSLQISFNFLTNQVSDKQEFLYHFIQRDKETNDIISAKTFCIKKGEVSIFNANAGNDKEIDKTQSVTLSAIAIDDPAIYNWYDPEGNLIYTGQDLTVSPEITKEYKLEVIKEADGFKDYDNVAVTVNPYVLGTITPNPVQGQVTINYIADQANTANLIFNEVNTNNIYNFILETTEDNIIVDMATFNTGIYFVILVCDGLAIDNTTLIKN